MEWPNDMTISLITDMENTPVLWDTNNPYYKISRERNDAWMSLANKYNTTPDEIKKKWQSLQASYRREKMKELTLPGAEAPEKEVSKWFAYQAMAFVGDRYTPRKTKNIIQISESEYRSNTNNHKPDEEDLIIEDSVMIEENVTADIVSDQQDSSPSSIPLKKARFSRYSHPKVTISRRPENDIRIQEVNDILKTTVANNINERDASEVYGEYVAKVLKSIDDHSRIVAKHYINQILFDAELGRYRRTFLQDYKGSIYSSDVSDTSI